MGITKESAILTVMNRAKSLYLFLLISMASAMAFGQPVNYIQEYEVAKTALDAGNYAKALSGFSSLLNKDPAHPMSAYTSYFYGISAYSLDQKEKAKDMFLQITRNYHEWEKLTEIYLWLCKISFELSSPNQGLFYADKVNGNSAILELKSELILGYLSQLDIATLKFLLEEHDEELIAQLIAAKMATLSYDQRDNDYLYSIIEKYKLDSATLGLNIPTDIIKDQYKIAIMLPLFVDRLWHSGVYLQKSLAVDIYEGIELAMAEFDSARIEIVVFDTKKDSLTTKNILQSGRLENVDAIIGPLYPKPLELISDYSNENKVNFINPVSTNSELIRHNPYGFLLRTGAESMGKIIAEFAKDKFEKKACAIYYGPRATDSLAAYNYSSSMEIDSFYVAIRQRTQTDKARELFDSLTSAVPVVDSVELERMWEEEEKVRTLPTKDSLLLKVDSLGHIFIASDNKAIASEVMSAITSRGDSTQLIGVGNWFSTANASLGLMESLGVWLAMQEYENMLTEQNISIQNKYRALYHKKPGKYVFYGYYAMKFLGEALLEYGVYFQNGYKRAGNINELFDFARSQDNQNLLLYKLEEGQPVVINRRDME